MTRGVETRPLDLDTPVFSTRFDENGLTICAAPYRGAELVWAWLCLTAMGAVTSVLMLDTAAPSLRLLARFRAPMAHPPAPWLGAIMVAVPALFAVWFGARLFYRLLGRETVHMDTGTVTITKSLLGVKRTRRYEMDEIRSVRTWGWSRPYWSYALGRATDNPGRGPFGTTEARRVIPSHPGGLFFVYDGLPVRFLTALRPMAAVEMLKVIAKIWPRLLATSEAERVSLHEVLDSAPVSPLNDTSPW